MTPDEIIDELGKWLEAGDAPRQVRLHGAPGGYRAILITNIGEATQATTLGPITARASTALTELAQQVMPKPQCCGECARFGRTVSNATSGECLGGNSPLPFWVDLNLSWRNENDGADCSAFQRRTA